MEQTIRLAIDGMHCANCVANVEKHYRALPSVIDVAVNLAEQHRACDVRPCSSECG